MTDSQSSTQHISIDPSTTTKPRSLSNSPLSPDRKSPMPPCSSSTSAPPAEIEATLTRLSSHQGVLGCLVLSRHDGLVIRSGGQMFDPSGPGAKGRAELLKSVTRLVKGAVEGLAADIRGIDESDELGFLRIRTKKYEIMITPNDKYLLVVLQDPNATAQ
ncbi:related to Dynein light chain 2B, cytoplasmic [Ustilago trichophora]|uniref:Related to Dynein light chain 2B, cytoplasmic n=2 Tax=Ustilago trichophora TaxID=86804 RepID=A0A5C3E1L0_9BASI|nr:related to Dynein light chain 2B, cytoplasmic [Ustilago trichophora]